VQFNIHSSRAASIAAFVATLHALVKPRVAVTHTDDHNALTGELSLRDVFEVARAYRERFGAKAEMMEEYAYPSVTASARAGDGGGLELRVISQVIHRGVDLHVYLRGRCGSLNLHVEESDRSVRPGESDVRFTAQSYCENAANEPTGAGVGYSGELVELWRAGDDAALAGRMAELHAQLTPKTPFPAYVVLRGPRELPDCSEEAEEGGLIRVEPGVYTLAEGDYANPNAAYRQILHSADHFRSFAAGMSLAQWEALAEASGGAVELVYHRGGFKPARDTIEYVTHEGLPFRIEGVTVNEGCITGYHIAFDDGFETDADPEEVELIPQVAGLTEFESAALYVVRTQTRGGAPRANTGVSLGRVGDALGAFGRGAADHLPWDWDLLEKTLGNLVGHGDLTLEGGFYKAAD
jgi:hypothetical protein